MLFHWDYWTIDAQPMVFLEELTARLNAETSIKKVMEEEKEKKRKKDEVVAQLRALNHKNVMLLRHAH